MRQPPARPRRPAHPAKTASPGPGLPFAFCPICGQVFNGVHWYRSRKCREALSWRQPGNGDGILRDLVRQLAELVGLRLADEE